MPVLVLIRLFDSDIPCTGKLILKCLDWGRILECLVA